jgi:hypothetical protein
LDEGERISISFGRQHLDLIKRIVATDNDSGEETISLEADPRRYNLEPAGETWVLIDRFESGALLVEDFLVLLRNVIHRPLYHEISDAPAAGEIVKKTLLVFVTGPRPLNG